MDDNEWLMANCPTGHRAKRPAVQHRLSNQLSSSTHPARILLECQSQGPHRRHDESADIEARAARR